MANGKWVRGMDKGGRAKGMESALWLTKGNGDAGTRGQACPRVPALMALVFVCAAPIFVFAWVVRARAFCGALPSEPKAPADAVAA